MVILVLGFEYLLSDLNAKDTQIVKFLADTLVDVRFQKLKATAYKYYGCNITSLTPKKECVETLNTLDRVNNMTIDYVNSAPPVSVLLKMLMCNNSNIGVSPFWKVKPVPACKIENK